MFYNDFEKALNARDRELWEGDDISIEEELCEKCNNQVIDEYYYMLPFSDDKLCKKCAKEYVMEDVNYFFTDEELIKICDIESIKELTTDLIEQVVDDILYKYLKKF